jgi:tRNA-2-methylthio-N6-dimethylallyladenosine synthase
VEHILSSVQRMAETGVVEVTLLGQNVNSYESKGVDFSELLRRTAAETDIKRIRFMTSHPKDLSRSLVDVMAEQSKIMPHIHLPLQSGCDRILRRMGRAYTWEKYREIVDYIHEVLPYVVLTTDLIVGFPTETDDEFQMTLDAVKYVQYDSAFMFRYSVRPGTRAASYTDDVPEAEKIRRLNTLIELQQSISVQRNQREVGNIRQCLVEGYSRRSEQFGRARSEGNKTVLFPTAQPKTGTVMPLRITSADAFTLHGESAEVA